MRASLKPALRVRLPGLNAHDPQPFQILKRAVIICRLSGRIFRITFRYHDRHTLSSTCKQHPVGIQQVFLSFRFMDMLPFAAYKRIALPRSEGFTSSEALTRTRSEALTKTRLESTTTRTKCTRSPTLSDSQTCRHNTLPFG